MNPQWFSFSAHLLRRLNSPGVEGHPSPTLLSPIWLSFMKKHMLHTRAAQLIKILVTISILGSNDLQINKIEMEGFFWNFPLSMRFCERDAHAQFSPSPRAFNAAPRAVCVWWPYSENNASEMAEGGQPRLLDKKGKTLKTMLFENDRWGGLMLKRWVHVELGTG